MKASRRRIRSSFLTVNEQRYIVAPFHWFLAPVPNDYYQFQQFSINQRDCAMEMSTDACVLGTTLDPHGATRLLDTSTGTELLALMAARGWCRGLGTEPPGEPEYFN